jgi:hypothetical protein
VSGRIDDLEVRYRWVSAAPIALFGLAFAFGLVVYLVAPLNPAALGALNAGLLLLIASPAARMAVALAERIRRADWTFVIMTVVIALELVVVLWRASVRS